MKQLNGLLWKTINKLKKMKKIFVELLIIVAFAIVTFSQPNREGKADDGFTWFETVPTFSLDATQSRVNTGWSLRSTLRFIGEYADGSQIKIDVAKGGKTLQTNICPTSSFHKPANYKGDSFMWTVACWNKSQNTLETGLFDVKVYSIVGGTEKLVRTYKIDVRKVDRVKGSIQKPEPDFPEYYINRHAETPVAFIYLRPAVSRGYTQTDTRSLTNQNQLEVHFNYSPVVSNGFGLNMGVCTVDGKQVTPTDAEGLMNTKVSSLHLRNYTATHTDRTAPQYQKGVVYKDQIAFDSIGVNLPVVWNNEDNRFLPSVHKFKGNWECRIMKDAEVIRIFRWKVGNDGLPVLHPEQANGNINLYYNAFLVEMEIPAGGSSLDNRLIPISADNGFFYGIPFSTPEGKAMGTKIPKKGNPFPIPSNMVK